MLSSLSAVCLRLAVLFASASEQLDELQHGATGKPAPGVSEAL